MNSVKRKTTMHQCTQAQAERVHDFLEKGWRIVAYHDGEVHIERGNAYKWVLENGRARTS